MLQTDIEISSTDGPIIVKFVDQTTNPTILFGRTCSGFPPPKANYYREKDNSELVSAVHTNTKWVTSLNFTIRQFYELHRKVALEIVNSRIYNAGWKNITTTL